MGKRIVSKEKAVVLKLTKTQIALLMRVLSITESEVKKEKVIESRRRCSKEQGEKLRLEMEDSLRAKQLACSHVRTDGSYVVAISQLSTGELAGYCPHCGKNNFQQETLRGMRAQPISESIKKMFQPIDEEYEEEIAKCDAVLSRIPEYQRRGELVVLLKKYREESTRTLNMSFGDYHSETHKPKPNGLALSPLDAPSSMET